MNNIIQENINDKKNYSLITFVLFWAGLVIMSSLYVTIPLISVFTKAFHVNPTEAVWTSSAFSICFAIGCLFYGPISERYGRKITILLGLCALIIISLILGLQHSLKWIIIFRGFTRGGSCNLFTCCTFLCSRVIPT